MFVTFLVDSIFYKKNLKIHCFQCRHHKVINKLLVLVFVYGPPREKTCLQGLRTTKVQTSLRSLISSFLICLLEHIISKLATSKFLTFLLVSVAEETGLSHALSETPKTGFVTSQPILLKLSLLCNM